MRWHWEVVIGGYKSPVSQSYHKDHFNYLLITTYHLNLLWKNLKFKFIKAASLSLRSGPCDQVLIQYRPLLKAGERLKSLRFNTVSAKKLKVQAVNWNILVTLWHTNHVIKVEVSFACKLLTKPSKNGYIYFSTFFQPHIVIHSFEQLNL